MAMLGREFASPSASDRALFLGLVLERPIGRAFGWVAPLLVDRHRPNRKLAAACLKVCATTDEESLAGIFPYFTYESGGQGEYQEAEDLVVRRSAVHAVHFWHGSKALQRQLLAAFDRPGLGIKRQLTNAFRFCPDVEELKQAMLERVQSSDAENSQSAWFVLGLSQDPEVRPRFHQALLSEDAETAYAGVLGLAHFLAQEDVELLQRVKQRWRPLGLTGRPDGGSG